MPKMSTVLPNGMIANETQAVTTEIAGASGEQEADRRARPELLLRDQLEDVRHRLQRAERADAVRAGAALEAAEQLAVHHQRERDHAEADDEDDQRLEDLDPPGLGVADGREDGGHAGTCVRSLAGVTFTSCGASDSSSVTEFSADASPRKTVPAGTLPRSATVAVSSAPSVATVTRSPLLEAEAVGVGGRKLQLLARGEELQRGRGLDLGRRPDRAVACRAAGRRSGSATGVGAADVERRRRRGGSRARRVPLLPAHAAPADLLQREACIEGDGFDELRASRSDR